METLRPQSRTPHLATDPAALSRRHDEPFSYSRPPLRKLQCCTAYRLQRQLNFQVSNAGQRFVEGRERSVNRQRLSSAKDIARKSWKSGTNRGQIGDSE